MHSIREYLAHHALFSKLDEDALYLLEQSARILPFQEHDRLAGGDEPVQSVFLILEGYVRMAVINESEEELALHFYGPGDMFGWTALYSQAGVSPTFFGSDNGRLLVLPHSSIQSVIEKSPAALEELNRFFAKRLSQAYQDLAAESSSAARGVDRYPIRMKVGDIMTSHVVTCTPETTVSTAAETMRDRNIGSLVVTDENHEIKGIVTDKDLVTRVLANRLSPDTTTVGTFLTDNPIVISQEAFYYEALLAMMNHQISHLPVIGRAGLTGILTMKDLLDAKSHRALDVTLQIERADKLDDLYPLAGRLDELVNRMRQEGMRSSDICKIMGDYEDRMHRKILHTIEKELRSEGYGSPPVPYCWLQMGSGGRMEQPRRTDQDNALLYRDPPDHAKRETEEYFAVFAERANQALESYGFPKCPGGVMAANPKWRKSLSEWKTDLAEWILQPDTQGVRNLTIFLDFRPIYGTVELAHELRLRVLYLTQNVPDFLHRLVMDDATAPIHMGWFEREVDLKTRLSVHFINALRILSLKHGLSHVNSLERLNALTSADVFQNEEADRYRDVYEEIMRYRVAGIQRIDLASLGKKERQRLKQLFHTTKDLQNFMIQTFRLEGLAL